MHKKVKTISFILPCLNEEGNIEIVYEKIMGIMKELNFHYECIFINDGSVDQTLKIIKELSKTHSEIKYISFTRNFGQQNALAAGLKMASGDAVISLDCDMQNPPELITKFIDYWQIGYKVVTTSRIYMNKTKFFKRKSSELFYKIFNVMSGLKISNGVADFRLLDRDVVNIINLNHENDLFIRGIVEWYGFKQVCINYIDNQRNSGVTNYSLKRMLCLGFNGIMSFSIKPLRLAFVCSVFFVILTLISIFYLFNFTEQRMSETSILMTLFLFSSALILFVLGVIGEYLGRIFIQSKERPQYIIEECSKDFNSSNYENRKI